jgi:hypothetical protein
LVLLLTNFLHVGVYFLHLGGGLSLSVDEPLLLLLQALLLREKQSAVALFLLLFEAQHGQVREELILIAHKRSGGVDLVINGRAVVPIKDFVLWINRG